MGNTESTADVVEVTPAPFTAQVTALLGQRFDVGSDGFIRLVDLMGSEAAIVQAARVSYGEGTKHISEDRTLIRYLLRHRHTTPFEMCLGGDARVPTFSQRGAVVKHYTMRQLADAFEAGGKENAWVKLLRIRTVDPGSGVVLATKIKRAWATGQKEAFRVSVGPWNRSLVATGNHPFLCDDGVFRRLETLRVGDRVALNGLPATPAEMQAAVCNMRRAGTKLSDIATAAGMPASTVYKILSKHGLRGRAARKTGYLRKAVGDHADPRNIARRRVVASRCAVCDAAGRDVHHIDENPHNNAVANLIRLCPKHHRHVHTRSLLERVFFAEITEIVSVGQQDVYDLEVESQHHCFVAEGFVVHNCELKFHVRVPMDVWRQWVRLISLAA